MYWDDSLDDVTKNDLREMLRQTHAAMCGLLWQIEDMRNYDDLMTESHFDDTVSVERAQYVHRILMTRSIDAVAKKVYFDKERSEFEKWVKRCDVARSFPDADKVFAANAR